MHVVHAVGVVTDLDITVHTHYTVVVSELAIIMLVQVIMTVSLRVWLLVS